MLSKYLIDFSALEREPERKIGDCPYFFAAIFQVHTDWLLWGEEPRDLQGEKILSMTKISQALTDADRIEAACSWLSSVKVLSSSQRQQLAEFIRLATQNWNEAEIAIELFEKMRRRKEP